MSTGNVIALLKNPRIYLSLMLLFGAIWWFSKPSDKQFIKKQLLDIASLSQISSKISPIEAAEKTKTLTSFVDAKVVFDFVFEDEQRFYVIGRKEIRSKLLLAYSRLSSLEVALQNIQVTVDEDLAIAEMDLSVLGSTGQRDDKFLEMHRASVHLERKGLAWNITKVMHLENLRE